MPDFSNDDHETEPVSNLEGLLQPSRNSMEALNTPTRGAFEDWLMEYRNRLANIAQDETKDAKDGGRR
jgi:hypothetical protein